MGYKADNNKSESKVKLCRSLWCHKRKDVENAGVSPLSHVMAWVDVSESGR